MLGYEVRVRSSKPFQRTNGAMVSTNTLMDLPTWCVTFSPDRIEGIVANHGSGGRKGGHTSGTG